MHNNGGALWLAVEKRTWDWLQYVGSPRDARYGGTRRILDRGHGLARTANLGRLEGLEALNYELSEPFSEASFDHHAIKTSELTDGNMGATTGYFTGTDSGECSGVTVTGKEVGGWF